MNLRLFTRREPEIDWNARLEALVAANPRAPATQDYAKHRAAQLKRRGR